jgi:hypothetical protein
MLTALLVFTIAKRNWKRLTRRNHFSAGIRMDVPFPENDLAAFSASFAKVFRHKKSVYVGHQF